MISCTFSFEIINAVVPGTKSLFWIPGSTTHACVINPSGFKKL